MNRKALVFSFDAVFALVVVIIAIGAIAMHHFSSEAESSMYESVSNKAMDRAVVGFYLGTTSNETINDTVKFGRCYTVLRYNPNNDLKDPTYTDPMSGVWISKKFCEGSG